MFIVFTLLLSDHSISSKIDLLHAPSLGSKSALTGVKKRPHWGQKAPSLGSKNALTGVKKRPHRNAKSRDQLCVRFFKAQGPNAWENGCCACERETEPKCVSLTPNTWDLVGLPHWVQRRQMIGRKLIYVQKIVCVSSASHSISCYAIVVL